MPHLLPKPTIFSHARWGVTLALFAVPAMALAQTPPTAPAARPERTVVATLPPADIANVPEQILALDLSTGGRVLIQLRPDAAPQTVERIKTLTRQGFYNGLLFHRVIEGFMAQGGDPQGDGTGGSQLADLPAEFNTLPHVRGAVSMARAQEYNSANSQFFIMLLPRLTLDGNYTVFGRVISGMEFVDRIERGEPPANPTRILQASILADNLPQPAPAALAPPAVAPPSPGMAQPGG